MSSPRNLCKAALVRRDGDQRKRWRALHGRDAMRTIIWGAALILAVALSSSAGAQSTPYGDCPFRAEVYQTRYEKSMNVKDLVCMQKALERELGGDEKFSCPHSAEHYQKAYERSTRTSDLVCMQQALERELQ